MGKNKGSSDYSTGSSKKWSIFLAVIVLIAIIVVIIVLAIPPNTYNAVQTLNRTSQTTFLTIENDKIQFDKFKTKIDASIVNSYTDELYKIQELTIAIDEVLDYHSQYLIFVTNNKTLKNNYKPIKNNLNNVKNAQKRMVEIMESTNKLSDDSSTYLQSAMIDFRKEYSSWLSASKNAINALKNVYIGSMGDVSFNNTASSMILNTVSDYLTIISEDFDYLVEVDVKGASIVIYNTAIANISLLGKIQSFTQFVDKYIFNEEVENYYFDKNIEEKYTKLNSFFEIYPEENLTAIIDSINTNGEITKTYQDIEDSENVYTDICNFVKGGL